MGEIDKFIIAVSSSLMIKAYIQRGQWQYLPIVLPKSASDSSIRFCHRDDNHFSPRRKYIFIAVTKLFLRDEKRICIKRFSFKYKGMS